MSGAAHADDHAHGHGSHGQDAHGHGSFKDYVTGFVLSVILTAIPFWLVMGNVIEDKVVTGVVILDRPHVVFGDAGLCFVPGYASSLKVTADFLDAAGLCADLARRGAGMGCEGSNSVGKFCRCFVGKLELDEVGFGL